MSRCRRAGRPPARARSDRGQATVELALALPVMMTLLLAAVQVAIVVRAQLAVTHAAREAARAAAVAAHPTSAAEQAARSAITLDDLQHRMSVTAAVRAKRVRVVVQAVVGTDVPLVGALIGNVTVSADATMSIET